MKNSIEARINFSYKGENYDLKSIIDLDKIMENQSGIPNIYMLLAKKNNVDTYSYLYEVMESHDITYTNATGDVAACLSDNQIDLEKYRILWLDRQAFNTVKTIAKKYLGIEDLDQEPQIKTALLEAFRKGKKA